jgi:hypothetical protein
MPIGIDREISNTPGTNSHSVRASGYRKDSPTLAGWLRMGTSTDVFLALSRKGNRCRWIEFVIAMAFGHRMPAGDALSFHF